MTKIKFCGTRSIETAAVINEIRPDYVGFILSPRFWRYVPPETVREIRAALHPEIKTVGVFVDNPLGEIAELLENGTIDIAQLHGNEDENFIYNLQNRCKKPIIKAFKIMTSEDTKTAQDSPADFVLLDSGTGTGESFDWSLIENFGRSFFLAGGLGPENVSKAIKMCRPYAVDVSSGIETDKVKDPAKMRDFAKKVRETI